MHIFIILLYFNWHCPPNSHNFLTLAAATSNHVPTRRVPIAQTHTHAFILIETSSGGKLVEIKVGFVIGKEVYLSCLPRKINNLGISRPPDDASSFAHCAWFEILNNSALMNSQADFVLSCK